MNTVIANDWINGSNDIERILEAIHSGLALTVEGMRIAAKGVVRLEKLGQYNRLIEIGLTPKQIVTFRRIGQGELLPEVCLNFKSSVADKVARLHIDEQKKLVDGHPIKVMLPGGDSLMVDAHRLKPKQAQQVFDDGFIRDDADQIAYLAEHGQLACHEPVEFEEPAMINRRTKRLEVNRPTEFTASQLMEFASQLLR